MVSVIDTAMMTEDLKAFCIIYIVTLWVILHS